MPPGRRHAVGGRRHREARLHLFKELPGRETVQVRDEAVVGQDPQLRGGEGHGEEPAALAREALLPGVAARGRTTVVAVRDIGDGNAREELHQFVRPAFMPIGDFPHRVADAVRRNEVVERRARTGLGNERVDGGIVLVGEERGAGVRVQNLNVARAVVLLVLARLLVLLQHAREVVLRVEGRHDARLGVVAHDLAVGVELRVGIPHERPRGEEGVERLRRLGVGGLRRAVRPVRHVDLGTRHMEETRRVPRRQRTGLGRIDDVVGNCGNGRRLLRRRPHG